MSKRTWKRLLPAASAVRLRSPTGLTVKQVPSPQKLPVSPLATTPHGPERTVALLARIFFCVIILVNLAAGTAIWMIRAQTIAQSARGDLSIHLAHLEALLERPDVLDPSVLGQLSSELAATRQTIYSLQNTLPIMGKLGIGSSGETARALQLGADMVQTVEYLVAAARVLQPGLVGFAESILEGPRGALQANDTRLTIGDVEKAQRDVAQAKQAWQQALNDWGAFSGSVRDISSPELNVIVRAMGRISHPLTVALVAASAVLDWSPALLGLKDPENILLIEENPDVLRPTGGAITHYAVLTLAQGVLSSDVKLQSIAALDCPQQVCGVSALPPAATWIPVSKAPVQVSNGNLDPDLTISGWSIYNHFEQEGGPRVAGIVVATQNVFSDILAAIGPITIHGLFDKFTADNVTERMRAIRASQAQVTQQGAIGSGTPVGDIDALMLDAIMTKLKSVTPEQRAALGHALLQALLEKDLQLFTSNNRVQTSLMEMNVAGHVLAPSGDSMEIVDTNVGGEAVNPSIAETAADSIMLDAHGNAQHKLSITYHYHVPADTLPPPIYTDVVRVIVPNATVGQNFSGPCTPLHITQAYHRVLACELTVAPGNSVTIGFSWQVPRVLGIAGLAPHAYTLLLQRQPGANVDIRVSIQAPSGQFLSAATAPGQLANGQLTFAAAPLVTDTTLQAFFRQM